MSIAPASLGSQSPGKTVLLDNSFVVRDVEEKDVTSDSPDTAWPYEIAFESTVIAEKPVELQVKGHIPHYASGTLYRTGPGSRQVKTSKGSVYSVSHWFDGFSQVHRFQIISDKGNSKDTSDQPGCRVLYNTRMTADKQIERIRRTGRLDGFSFAQKRDPCESFFKKVSSSFQGVRSRPGDAVNIGVTLSVNLPGLANNDNTSQIGVADKPLRHSSGLSSLTAKTDNPMMQRLDPDTLEPLGIASQSSLHPLLKGPLSCAHAKSDPITGDVFNFNLALGPKATYRVFRISATTGRTDILATLHVLPAYLHSFWLTSDHVVLCVWNSHINPSTGLKMLWERNVLSSIGPYDDSQKAQWYVIDRLHGKGVIATYEGDPFFAFHTTNAWIEPDSASDASSTKSSDKVNICAEVSAYTSLSVLHEFYYERLISASSANDRPDSARARLHRFRLSSIPSASSSATPSCLIYHPSPFSKSRRRRSSIHSADLSQPHIGVTETVFATAPDATPELPSLNPRYLTKPHRFTYGIVERGRHGALSDGLVKLDSTTRERVGLWEQDSCSPGEAIFIPEPIVEGETRTEEEDAGVLLSVVLDGKNARSFLLCLNARDLREIGRAELEGVVGLGFHGCHVGSDIRPDVNEPGNGTLNDDVQTADAEPQRQGRSARPVVDY